MRYYGDRLSIAWDGFRPEDLEPTLAVLQRAGRRPYLLFETFEEPRFRDRFAGVTPLAALDWPPIAVIGRDVRLFDPADRDVYAAGGRPALERRKGDNGATLLLEQLGT